jgi:L-2-hydroxycarboxylate dehydrogenase (NAD+)
MTGDVRVDAELLRAFVAMALGAVGVREEDARITADVLVTSDLRGHESHGVARLETFYVRPIQSGRIDPMARMAVRHETAATLVCDAANGLGQPAAKRAMDLCIAKARTAGVCVASVRHSNHYGIAGYYAMQALAHDMIGFCCTDAGPLAVPTGGRAAVLGSNPIAFAAPAGRQRPFVLDMATSVVPVGKVEVKARRAAPLPAGWAVDEEGRPATDAREVLDRLDGALLGGLMPLGGLEAGHKGYGLSVMVDILCGVLAGARSGLGGQGAHSADSAADVGHVVGAIDIAAFGPVDDFMRDMDAYIDKLHHVPPAPGVDRVRVAGELEFEAEQDRLRDGIPLHPDVAASLRALGDELGIATPRGRAGL